jgi:cytochrome P450
MSQAQAKSWIPDHVPAELAWDHVYDQFVAAGDDPFRTIGALHAGPDMLWARGIDPWRSGWLPTRHALIREILTDSETFSSVGREPFMKAVGLDWWLIPLEYDPPDHHLYRKALEPFFSPSAVNELDGAVRAICNQLVDDFARSDGCELIGEFAEKFLSRFRDIRIPAGERCRFHTGVVIGVDHLPLEWTRS